MSENERPTDNLTDEGKQALSALRGIWQAKGQTSAELDEACGNTKACKNMDAVGFQGLADGETPSSPDASVGNNLRAAWKNKLEREGKLSTQTGSVRDIVFGSSEHKE
ncbi:MAG: hypothetical protein M3460_19890 [Actinomycetota bacterium]|jgi:hypothetical protein|nr:hypothetical protein [Actinomycetota bacterium]